MSKILVGYTGTVGKNLLNQSLFSEIYNSSNIETIKNKTFDEVYLSCLPATKWMINKNPDKDTENMNKIIELLKTIKCKFVYLISTIDIYPIKNNESDEDTYIEYDICDTYGKNRYLFEQFIINNFDNYLIARLPGLFGDYLKKNIIYDLINDNNLEQINTNSKFQWYFLDNIYSDLQKYKKKNIKIINLFTEPITNDEIISLFFNDKKIYTKNNSNIIEYNLTTKYNGEKKYLYSKNEILKDLEIYLKRISIDKYICKNNMEKIIFSNLAWKNNETEQILNMLQENKINNIELALTKFCNWNDMNEEKILEIKNIFEKRNINIYSLQAITFGLDYNLFSESKIDLLNHLKKIVKYANLLGCKLIVFGSPKNRSHNNNFDIEIAIKFFTELNETAKLFDIIVCIEPNARVYNCNFLWNVEQTYNFIKQLNCSHIKMMVDTGCMSFEEDKISDIYKYQDEIKHVHLSERYLEILTNNYTEHFKLSEILINCNIKYITIEMKENISSDNINKIYNTILFIKENYKEFIKKL